MTITPLAEAGIQDGVDLVDAVLGYLERIQCDGVQAFASAMEAFERVQATKQALRRGSRGLRLRHIPSDRLARLQQDHDRAVAEFCVFDAASELLRVYGVGPRGDEGRKTLLRKVRAGEIDREDIEGAGAVLAERAVLAETASKETH